MSKMSNYLENAIINRILRGVAFTPVAQPYLGFFTAFTEGADGDTFTEVTTSGTAYARQAATFSAPSAGATANSNAIAFAEATANWGTVTHFGVFDAATSGNLLYWGDMTDISVLTGETMAVAIGDIDITVTGNLHQTWAHNIINSSLRNTALSAPTTYVALLTAFTNDSTFTECADGAYARQLSTWNAPSNGLCDNVADIVYAAAASGFTATHVALFDAVSAGNMIFRGPLAANKVVGAGKVFKFLAGALDIALL